MDARVNVDVRKCCLLLVLNLTKKTFKENKGIRILKNIPNFSLGKYKSKFYPPENRYSTAESVTKFLQKTFLRKTWGQLQGNCTLK